MPFICRVDGVEVVIPSGGGVVVEEKDGKMWIHCTGYSGSVAVTNLRAADAKGSTTTSNSVAGGGAAVKRPALVATEDDALAVIKRCCVDDIRTVTPPPPQLGAPPLLRSDSSSSSNRGSNYGGGHACQKSTITIVPDCSCAPFNMACS